MKAEPTEIRQEAILKWNTLTRNEQIALFLKYKKDNFTPAIDPMELTGREIEIIIKNKLCTTKQ